MNKNFDIRLYKPRGAIAGVVQGIWAASVNRTSTRHVKRWLQGDARSGLLFNLNKQIYLDDKTYPTGVLILPVSKQAHSLYLPPGSEIAGIRFHPGMGFGMFRTDNYQPALLPQGEQFDDMHALLKKINCLTGLSTRITIMYKWLKQYIVYSSSPPPFLLQSLHGLAQFPELKPSQQMHSLSQRQMQRQFKKWLDMTPKQFQRILRVQKTMEDLKNDPQTNLVSLALSNGFSDQAHMTREVKQIAKITPQRYIKCIVNRNKHYR